MGRRNTTLQHSFLHCQHNLVGATSFLICLGEAFEDISVPLLGLHSSETDSCLEPILITCLLVADDGYPVECSPVSWVLLRLHLVAGLACLQQFLLAEG